jgi:hypothetical protein
VAAGALSLLCPREASAYRPFDGTDTEVAELGTFEWEFGPAHYYTTPAGRYLLVPATVLNLGVAPNWELVIDAQNVVGLGHVPGEARDRLLDTDLLLKHVLRDADGEGNDGVGAALEFGPLFPNINGDEKGLGLSADLIITKRWDFLTLHLNSQPMLSRTQHAAWFESIIIEGPRDWPVRPVSEIFVEGERTVGGKVSTLVGAVWAASPGFDVDLALRGAIEYGDKISEIRLGFTWVIPVWEARHDRP